MAALWIKRTLTTAAAAVLLAACQSAALPEGAPATASVLRSGAQVLAQVKEKTNEPDLYFSAEGQYHSQPQAGGYFRRVLGKTADGSWVVQDFYQDNQAKQIDPALIFHPEGLRNFDNDVVQGRVVWYRKDGSLMQSIVFDRGLAQGWQSHYDRQGRLRWLIGMDKGEEDGRAQAFNEAGRLIYRFDAAKGEREMWHDNGRLAMKVRLPLPENAHLETAVIEGWDEQGKALTPEQAQLLADYLISKTYDLNSDSED
ncbi:hypothetical protein L1281_001525 [Neisseria sp. HSC-16F19]|nr:hypothetical protein [Neisseria sp. HSC-16F19]MCP2040935.1 hypothetical protein [Neisseria sp. HSC-16F19]